MEKLTRKPETINNYFKSNEGDLIMGKTALSRKEFNETVVSAMK